MDGGRRRLASLVPSSNESEAQNSLRSVASSAVSPDPENTARSAEEEAVSVNDDVVDDFANALSQQYASRTLQAVLIEPPKDFDRTAYRVIGAERIVKVLKEAGSYQKGLVYLVRLGDGTITKVDLTKLLKTENGKNALERYRGDENSSESESDFHPAYGSVTRPKLRIKYPSDVIELFSDHEDDDSDVDREEEEDEEEAEDGDENTSDSEQPRRARRGVAARKRKRDQQPRTRPAVRNGDRRSSRLIELSEEESDEDEDSDDDGDILFSDVVPRKKKRKVDTRPAAKEGTRRSSRSNRARNHMGEIGVEDIYRTVSAGSEGLAPPKAATTREFFQPLPRGNPFRERHNPFCDTCKSAHSTSAGQLVYCQGCSLSYHRACLGPRGSREHLVTKVGDEDFVLQCRRCVNTSQKKDPYAPDMARCQDCRKKGASCNPFRTRKTTQQEQKEREENNGEDPIYDVPENLVNNALNVLFRCLQCSRAFHFHHLESRNQYAMNFDDEQEQADTRFSEYAKDWLCKECADMPGKLGGIVAWRPSDVEIYQPNLNVATIEEDEKEYLIKWQDFSYFRAQWMPGTWVWGVLSPSSRLSFFKKYPAPKLRTEDAIPEEWLRIDIVLDVKYTNVVDFQNMEIQKARIKEVGTALMKYKGLGYEDAVWEKVPSPDDGERWTDFVTAYHDWVLGRYTTLPSSTHLRDRINKAKQQPFKEREKKEQPDNLEGGKLMNYQLEGLNWLYYQWHQGKNGILADEMGLGKTIQVIAFLAMMVQDLKCYPFLVVVPNSTCPNWRREIKQWAPSLRVVTYYGSSVARDMAYKYELFPGSDKKLRAHVVVTSYEAVVDAASRKFLRSVSWQGLIVDEGQRLKNDSSILHNALDSLRVPFRILLTGTPLQNNARELFNLLQFLDDTINAEHIEKEFEEMTNEKITRLHDLIRPFILRRTKAQVLSFLPPMAQIILPVSMSHLQKKTYKSILEQKPELLKYLLSDGHLKTSERVSLNNILMQLRKCLCHPFVFNQAIEERHLEQAVTHKNLVEASAKLQLLELLLPKLQERGHRVLIFSQFLDMLDITEDFLDGMGLPYQRLDGSISAMEKQKRIDEFNAPASPLFAFLLSTRAGGVGINLATADTVIILDPDFNPHQDIQAISRAHRIGQTKKVLCFQLMTRSSAEEKIMQVGRKKMALDEVVIGQLDEDDMEDKDMAGILKHGMAQLFNEDSPDLDIKYDEASTEKLLDRSQIENTKAGADNTAESQFSFARVWENDTGGLADSLDVPEEEQAPDKGLWEKILQDRERKAAERAAKAEFGRGKRQRQAVDYGQRDVPPSTIDGQEPSTGAHEELPEPVLATPEKPAKLQRRKRKPDEDGDESDTDFQLIESDDASSDEDVPPARDDMSVVELNGRAVKHIPTGLAAPAIVKTKPQVTKPKTKQWKRVNVPPVAQQPPIVLSQNGHPLPPTLPDGRPYPRVRKCGACNQSHPVGSCPLKIAGVEHCNLCGLAHFGHMRNCPHLKSETMVRTMLAELKYSSEPMYIVEAAMKYLKGLKGNLVQLKRNAKGKAAGMQNGTGSATGSLGASSFTQSVAPVNGYAQGPAQGYAAVNQQHQPHYHQQQQQQQPGPSQGSVEWNRLPVEERLTALTGFQLPQI